MDRTNWKYGCKNINYLVISIAWQGSSIPIVWICLMKSGGNSNTEERITLMKRLLELIPAEKIDSLLADHTLIHIYGHPSLDEIYGYTHFGTFDSDSEGCPSHQIFIHNPDSH